MVSLTCTSLCQVLCRCVDAKCANTWIPASVSAILPTCQTHPVSAANWIAKYRASNSHTSLCVSTFSSQWFLVSSTCTERPIAVEFFLGWMATASPVNNHGRITSGGFYRSGVETTCSLSRIFKTRPFVFGVLVCSDTSETLAPSVCRSVRKHPGPATKGGMFRSVNNLTQQYGNCLHNFCSMNQAILIDYLDGRASDHRQGDSTCNSRHCNTPEIKPNWDRPSCPKSARFGGPTSPLGNL